MPVAPRASHPQFQSCAGAYGRMELCWSIWRQFHWCKSAPLQTHSWPKTRKRVGRVGRRWSNCCGVKHAVWNSQRRDHRPRGTGGRVSGHVQRVTVAVLTQGNSNPDFCPPAHPAVFCKKLLVGLQRQFHWCPPTQRRCGLKPPCPFC